jgi:putative transposase
VLLVLLAGRLSNWREALLIVKPETILRWHRELFRWHWRQKTRHQAKAGRPTLAAEHITLIRQMARENLTWGAERIRGELLKLGIHCSKSTIQHYLKGRRVSGPGRQTWSTFLHNHAAQIWACDFLQTYDIGFRALFVFVMIELSSRRVVQVSVTRHPSQPWVAQQLRDATPFGQAPRFLIRDNDTKYGPQFDAIAAGVGIKVLRTPFGAPKGNAVCERFLGSLRRECLDHLILYGERHLLEQTKAYVAYFNHARPHQGIGQQIPLQPRLQNSASTSPIVSIPVLNGLHHDYRRQAA